MPAGVALAGLYRGAYRPLDIAGAVLLGLLWLATATFALDPNVDLHQPPPLAVGDLRSGSVKRSLLPSAPVRPWCSTSTST